ncbi:MAG: protein-L-isoaspartate(D-aspartate) O-methyltransferase [Bacteroidales bacterium]|nr:protein-L-isoaspartate(D-aspartate) O-methyltransferase [Bacteroidales bacterium]
MKYFSTGFNLCRKFSIFVVQSGQQMEDTYRHKGLRRLLVEELVQKGITDEKVLEAIGKVLRHAFIRDSALIRFAYQDQAFPIGAGQTISQPYTVAFQTQLLQVKSFDKILEIGTGSGYQAAVLCELGARVYTIERQRELHVKAQQLLEKMGYKMHFYYGDGYAGLPAYAPFDRILVTAGAADIPDTLVRQLKTGGRMVIPVGNNGQQEMILIEKTSETETVITQHGAFAFVPFLRGKT